MHSFVCCQEIECSKLSEFFRVVLVLSFCMDMAVPCKRDIPRTLPTIARDGWAPFAQGMTGYRDHAPSWCGDDLRPVVGTSCDFRFAPTEREQLLLLSLWRRMRVPCLPNNTALRTWLSQKGDVPLARGPDHRLSPHSVIREVDYETLFQGGCMQIATTSDSMEPTREKH